MNFERLKLEVYSILRRLFNVEQEIKTKFEQHDRAFDITEDISLVSCPTGNVVASLPTAESSKWKVFTVKKVDGINQVEVTANGIETIDGFNPYNLTVQYQSVTIYSDGTDWHIISIV